jgi:5'-3' exonuclease
VSAGPAPLLAVDAPSVLYRAFFALPKTIRGTGGASVNALLGSVNMVLQAVDSCSPRAVAVCFGQDAADYRVEAFSGYHADRPPVPDELEPQFAVAPRFFEQLGWQPFSAEGLEADDVLHSLARAEERGGGRALIMTGDRDLYQSVTDNCAVLYLTTKSRKPELVDEQEVVRRYGVTPALVPDLIALRGDPSDGIPGGRGIGPKTAADLLRRHGSLEGALAGAAGEPRRVAMSLRDQADQLRQFREIAVLRELALEPPPDRPTDRAGGAAAARALGMNRLADRLSEGH